MTFGSGMQALGRDVEAAGYYPALVLDVLSVALANESVVDHFVHVETTFVMGQVQRHVTVFVLTQSRLILCHVDDRPADDENNQASAAASTESIPLKTINSIGMTFGVLDPEAHESGAMPQDVTIAIVWGAVSRIDIGPADCGDPNCTAEHGMSGTISPDDVVLRVSVQAEGEQHVLRAVQFAKSLSRASAQHSQL